jgi:hypothetical protein
MTKSSVLGAAGQAFGRMGLLADAGRSRCAVIAAGRISIA